MHHLKGIDQGRNTQNSGNHKSENCHPPHFPVDKVVKVEEKSAPVPAASLSNLGKSLKAGDEVRSVFPDIEGQVLYRQSVDFLVGAHAAKGGGVGVISHEVWGRLLIRAIGILIYTAGGRGRFARLLLVEVIAADFTKQFVGGVDGAAAAAPFGGVAVVFFLVGLDFGRLPLFSFFVKRSEDTSAAFLDAFLVVGGAAFRTDDDLVGFGEFFVTIGAVDAFIFEHAGYLAFALQRLPFLGIEFVF